MSADEQKQMSAKPEDAGTGFTAPGEGEQSPPSLVTPSQKLPSGEIAPILYFTNFYNQHCYTLLLAVFLVNAAIGIYLFVASPQPDWGKLIPVLMLTIAIVGTFFSFVEDKSKVPLSKRIATLVVIAAVPAIQLTGGWIKDERYKQGSRIEDTEDIVRFREAYRIVQESDYNPDADTPKNVRKVIPTLKELSIKYPYHRQVLYALGLAQFETGQYEEAKRTFELLNRVSPNDFEVLYNLGIALKKVADTIELQEQRQAGYIVPYCGSPTAPWSRQWHPPSDETIRRYREEAKLYLETSLSYYFGSPIQAETVIGVKIARNIGWLCYQLSDGCKRERMCDDAIAWHEYALGIRKHDQFTGNPRYVLAFVNLGEIYRTRGDKKKSYDYLNEALKIHQDLVQQNSPQARNQDYHCLYQILAQYYGEDGNPAKALEVERMGSSIFR